MQSNNNKRARDLAESYHLLLELLTSEPFIQECLQMIENVCLSQKLDFKIAGKSPSDEFGKFINKHYFKFLKNAIRQAHGMGFVAWFIRKLPSGDRIPDVLPLGTFTWSVEPDEHSVIRYRVQLSTSKVPFVLTEWVQPCLNVSEGSILHATIQSPLSHLIEEYRILRETMRRYHHADAWNTTARIIVSSEPKQFNHDSSQKELFDTLDFLKDAMKERQKHAPSEVDDVFAFNPGNHRAAVYELPPHHHVEAMQPLKPVVDLPFMTAKYRHSVCSLFGIPSEMVVSDRSAIQRETRGGRTTSRVFQNKMARMCIFLSDLLQEVYRHIYKEDAQFNLTPIPRLELQNIEDLRILHEISVLQPDHAVSLGDVLLGASGKRVRGVGDAGGGDAGGTKKIKKEEKPALEKI